MKRWRPLYTYARGGAEQGGVIVGIIVSQEGGLRVDIIVLLGAGWGSAVRLLLWLQEGGWCGGYAQNLTCVLLVSEAPHARHPPKPPTPNHGHTSNTLIVIRLIR